MGEPDGESVLSARVRRACTSGEEPVSAGGGELRSEQAEAEEPDEPDRLDGMGLRPAAAAVALL